MSTRPVAARPSRFYNGGAPAARVLQVRPSPRCQRAAVRLFRGEAVEEAVAAGALEIVLAAAAVGPARGVRRVPGLRRVVVAQALPIVMADHRRPLAALRPVAAGAVIAGCERGAVGLRAGQDVGHVGCVATAVDQLALFGARTGNEERHLTLLGVRDGGSVEPQQDQRSQDPPTHSVHVHPSVAFGVGEEYRLTTSGEAVGFQAADGTDQAPRHEGYDGARAPRKLRTRRPALIVEHDDLGKRRDASASCMYGG